MTDIRSLRALLLVNTLLAGGLLWTIVVEGSSFTASADAAPQYRSSRASEPPAQAVTGVGNAAARQRDRMILALDSISKRLQSVEKKLADGRIDVRIENVDDLRIDYARLADAIRRATKSK